LRQAYDYWQDQPGNYFPKPLSRPSLTRGMPEGTLPLSRRGVHQLLFASNIVDPPQLADTFPPTTTLGGGTSNLKPTDGVTLFPVLTRLEQDPLVP
jgi:hypothetical protein